MCWQTKALQARVVTCLLMVLHLHCRPGTALARAASLPWAFPLIAMFFCGASSVTSNSRWEDCSSSNLGYAKSCLVRRRPYQQPWPARLSGILPADSSTKQYLWPSCARPQQRVRELLDPQYLLQCQDAVGASAVMVQCPAGACGVRSTLSPRRRSTQCSSWYALHLNSLHILGVP